MKKTIFLLFILSFLICSKTKATNQDQPGNIQELIDKYQYNEALLLLDKAIQEQPSTALYVSKAKILRSTYAYLSAIECFEKALQLDNNQSQLLIEIANTYKLKEDYAQSYTYFSKALARDTSNFFLQLECANCELLNDQYRNALRDFTKLYQKDSLNYFVTQMIAHSYRMIGQSDSSILYYKRAVKINPTDPSSVLALSNLYISKKQYAEGTLLTEDYRSKVDAFNKRINSNNALLYLKDKKFSIAINRFQNCVDQKDTTAFIYKHLGIAYYQDINYKAAKIQLEKALQKDSDDINTLQFLSLTCTKLLEPENAIRYLELAAPHFSNLESETSWYYKQLSDACMMWSLCPCEKRSAVTMKAFQYNPDDPFLIVQAGSEYEKVKDYSMALELYKRSLSFVSPKVLSDPKRNEPFRYTIKKVEELKALLKEQK